MTEQETETRPSSRPHVRIHRVAEWGPGSDFEREFRKSTRVIKKKETLLVIQGFGEVSDWARRIRDLLKLEKVQEYCKNEIHAADGCTNYGGIVKEKVFVSNHATRLPRVSLHSIQVLGLPDEKDEREFFLQGIFSLVSYHQNKKGDNERDTRLVLYINEGDDSACKTLRHHMIFNDMLREIPDWMKLGKTKQAEPEEFAENEEQEECAEQEELEEQEGHVEQEKLKEQVPGFDLMKDYLSFKDMAKVNEEYQRYCRDEKQGRHGTVPSKKKPVINSVAAANDPDLKAAMPKQLFLRLFGEPPIKDSSSEKNSGKSSRSKAIRSLEKRLGSPVNKRNGKTKSNDRKSSERRLSSSERRNSRSRSRRPLAQRLDSPVRRNRKTNSRTSRSLDRRLGSPVRRNRRTRSKERNEGRFRVSRSRSPPPPRRSNYFSRSIEEGRQDSLKNPSRLDSDFAFRPPSPCQDPRFKTHMSLASYFREWAKERKLSPADGEELINLWRIARHDEDSLLSLSERNPPLTRNEMQLLFIKEMSVINAKDVPDHISLNSVIEETVNYFLDLFSSPSYEPPIGRYRPRTPSPRERTDYFRKHRRSPVRRQPSDRRRSPVRRRSPDEPSYRVRNPLHRPEDSESPRTNHRERERPDFDGPSYQPGPSHQPPRQRNDFQEQHDFPGGNESNFSDHFPRFQGHQSRETFETNAPRRNNIPVVLQPEGPPIGRSDGFSCSTSFINFPPHRGPRTPPPPVIPAPPKMNHLPPMSFPPPQLPQQQAGRSVVHATTAPVESWPNVNPMTRPDDWEAFQIFLVKKMSAFNAMYGIPSSNLAPIAEVVKGLMVKSGLDRSTLKRWNVLHGNKYVQDVVKERIEPYKNCLNPGMTVGYIVSLVAEFITLN